MYASGYDAIWERLSLSDNANIFYLPFLYSSVTPKMLWIMPVGRYVGCRMMWSMHQIAQILSRHSL